MIGKGRSVSVLWRDGEVDTIFGFEKEADALNGSRKSRKRGSSVRVDTNAQKYEVRYFFFGVFSSHLNF
jgi:hypothetical protein